MSKPLTIGNETFQYPEEGTKPGWGEDATSWAVAVTDKLGTLSGVNDINCTCIALAAGVSGVPVGTGASALSFPTSSVRSFVVDYAVTRGIFVEAGNMEGVYNGSDWCFNHSFIGYADVCFDITSSGQIRYYTQDAIGDGCCGTIVGGVDFLCCTCVRTITRACGSFLADGFYVGSDLIITDSLDPCDACTNNNGTYTILSLSPTIVTVAESVNSYTADTTAEFNQSKGVGTIRFRARTIDY